MKILYIVLLLSMYASAQKSIKVTYEQLTTFREGFFDEIPENTREQTKKLMTSPATFELINNSEFSLFKTVDAKDILIPAAGEPEVGVLDQGTTIKLPKVWILKDFNSRKTFAKRNIAENNYYVEEEFQRENLTFTNEIQTIEKFNCKMVYSFPKNKPNDTIKYWYTEEIPSIDGPYYAAEIPGLILKYERKNRLIYAIKIEFFDKQVNIERLDENIPVVSEKEFKAIRENLDKPQNYTNQKGHNVISTTKKISQ